MNHTDAKRIANLIFHLAVGPKGFSNRELYDSFIAQYPEGVPGTGECMCQRSPERVRIFCERTLEEFAKYTGTMLLDHRCPKHGEKAQPTLWGRHKEKVLEVTTHQWISLGVEFKTP